MSTLVANPASKVFLFACLHRCSYKSARSAICGVLIAKIVFDFTPLYE